MLALSNRLSGVPIMSLQTGMELASSTGYIIDPKNLHIVALYVDGPMVNQHPSILHISDIREVSDMGFIVDDSEVLMATDDLVRLQEVIDTGFEPIGMPVHDEHGTKLGKVSDFAFEPESFYIQQLYSHQSLLRNLATASNVINRDQIVAITKDKIVVRSATIKDAAKQAVSQATDFVNPFRSPGRVEPNQSTRR